MRDAMDDLLREQVDYYRARASEYDEWFLRQGRYDHGAELNARWFAEVDEAVRALEAFGATGEVLELAAGTGLWTQRLARTAASVTVVDSAPEMLALNAARVGSPAVQYVQADLFSWRPARRYDVVFFSFWLSHVPPERFDAFWRLVRECLAPGGRVFFLDGLYTETSTAMDHQLEGPEAAELTRRLNDGREFRIVKVFHRPEELSARLRALGWQPHIQATANYFYFGTATPDPDARLTP